MGTNLAQVSFPAESALAWAGLGAVAVPIVIHLLTRLRRQLQPWGAMRFLLEAYRRHRSRLRLEQWLLLLVRCLVLAVLGIALAGPVLTGCADFGGPANTGRSVYIVLDDSLSTHAEDLNGASRFDRLRKTAINIVAALDPTDRVTIWQAARPHKVMPSAGTNDHLEVRRRLEALRPRFSRSDLTAALESASQAIEPPSPPERTVVVVLSDWATDAVDIARPLPTGLTALGDRSRLFIARPTPSADNVQVTAIKLRRYLLLAESDGSAIVTADVTLQRITAESGPEQTPLQLIVQTTAGEPLGPPIKRTCRWAPGQTTATLHVELPITAEVVEAQTATSSSGDAMIVIAAHIKPSSFDDALTADNRRWALFQLRRQFHVAVIDVANPTPTDHETGYTPRALINYVLNPSQPQWGPAAVESRIKTVDLEPARTNATTVAPLDAAIILRPDLLNADSWRALRQLTDRGGLIWLFMPDVATPTLWASVLEKSFGLDWQLSLEPQPAATDQGWTLATDATAPQALNLLTSEWQSLLRPVRIFQRYTLTTSAEPQQIWITTEDSQPLLVSADIGPGRVMLLATAIGPAWTNLATKPLFIPLLHESLRSAMGTATFIQQLNQFVCGDQLSLTQPWRGVTALEINQVRLPVQHTKTALISVRPFPQPGIYHTVPSPTRHLAVNIDPAAGQTRALPAPALKTWLDQMNRWQWLDEQDPAGVLTQKIHGTALGRPLLWLVLALVLFETLLARRFSHARSGAGVAWRSRLSGWVKG